LPPQPFGWKVVFRTSRYSSTNPVYRECPVFTPPPANPKNLLLRDGHYRPSFSFPQVPRHPLAPPLPLLALYSPFYRLNPLRQVPPFFFEQLFFPIPNHSRPLPPLSLLNSSRPSSSLGPTRFFSGCLAKPFTYCRPSNIPLLSRTCSLSRFHIALSYGLMFGT